jgi:hypothetical protein
VGSTISQPQGKLPSFLCRRNCPPSYGDSLEHSVVILLDDAYKDQAHSVSPFDEEAAAELCLISNHHRRSPPKKNTLLLQALASNARHYSKPRQRKKTKQNKTNTPQTKLHHQYQTQNPQELCFWFTS